MSGVYSLSLAFPTSYYSSLSNKGSNQSKRSKWDTYKRDVVPKFVYKLSSGRPLYCSTLTQKFVTVAGIISACEFGSRRREFCLISAWINDLKDFREKTGEKYDQRLEEKLKNLARDAYVSAYHCLSDNELKNKLRTELGLSEDIENDIHIKNVLLQEADLKIATQDAYSKVYKALIAKASAETTVTDILLNCAKEWKIDTDTQTLLLEKISDDDVFQLWEYSTEHAEKTESNSNSQSLATDACSICKRQGFISKRTLAKHEKKCRETQNKQPCQNIFNPVVRRPRTPRFEVAKPVEKESQAVPSCNQISPVTDECCMIEHTPILVRDDIWLKGDPGFPEQEQCFPNQSQHKTNKSIDQIVDKKFGLHYSIRKKTDGAVQHKATIANDQMVDKKFGLHYSKKKTDGGVQHKSTKTIDQMVDKKFGLHYSRKKRDFLV